MRIRGQPFVQPLQEQRFIAMFQLPTRRHLRRHAVSDDFLNDHEPRRILWRMSTVTAPPELAEPTPIWKLEVLQTGLSQVNWRATASSTIDLPCFTTIAADDRLVVSLNDHVLSRHAGAGASASPPAAKSSAPIASDASIAAFSAGCEIRFTCCPTLRSAVAPFDGRVAACRPWKIVTHDQ